MKQFKNFLTGIIRFLRLTPGIQEGQAPTLPGRKDAAPASHKTSRLQSALPPYPVVWVYFTANGYPDAEAKRFYKRYQLLGWNTRIIPTLENWQELADHWMQQVRQPPNRKPPKSPPNDTHSGSDHSDTEPV